MKSFFWKKEKPKTESPPVIPEGMRAVDETTLILSIPHLHPGVERISDQRYGCLLAWPIPQPKKEKRKTWLGRLFAGPDRKRRLVLDDLGRRTVELMDGKRSLTLIAELLARDTGHSRREMEKAVLSFMGQLVRRNAATLIAPDKAR